MKSTLLVTPERRKELNRMYEYNKHAMTIDELAEYYRYLLDYTTEQ